ncbi:hypothetical protein EMPS_02523 [Entomortierella parvispora]|uniref:Uncharacterized protein n=1 Tax=Entomortierella parvispora TaxID=205924 RepID=A0A9P3H524_9FUNG|nr:hypothetical protein EMPS_02523 [Entomortierella parvispora]
MDIMTLYSLQPNPYPNVSELKLQFIGAPDNSLVNATELVRKLPGLKNLHLEDTLPLVIRGLLWNDILLACPPLDSLTLNMILLREPVAAILPHLQSLVTFKVYESQIGRSGNIKSRMLNLTLHRSSLPFSQQLEWATSCPNLRSLYWDSTGTSDTEMDICREDLLNQDWPGLNSISLHNSTTSLHDLIVALMLKASGSRLGTPGAQLENVTVYGTSFWFRSLAGLELHFSTLAELNLYKCENLRGWMGQYIMENCPCLVSFRGAIIDAHDLIDYRWSNLKRDEQEAADTKADDALIMAEEAQGEIAQAKAIRHLYEARGLHNRGKWMCKDLQHLSFALLFPKDDSIGWDKPALRRVGELVNLRYLEFWMPDNRREDSRAPHLILASRGLQELAPLVQLGTFLFHGTDQILHEEDIRWMCTNWTHLRKITADLHPDPVQCDKLQKLFKLPVTFVDVEVQ